MFQRVFLFAQLGVASVLAGLHIYAMTNFYYWIYPWFDIPTHLLGGIWAGLFVAWILALRQKSPAFILCIAGALSLGIVWEVFETANGLTQFPAGTLDTVKDLTTDVIGGSAAALFARYITRP
ncbi:MAG: hypothetical protein Q7S05_03530 [bacterium]|nr:hypothetical protein [bacterium]